MSWLGGHLTSFTEKITDLTKEYSILPDSGSDSATDDQQSVNYHVSQKSLLDHCKEKDVEIASIMREKVALEKSLEELELQHQEAVNKLLELKNDAVKENIIIKEELAVLKELNSVQSLFQKFEHNYNPGKLKSGETNSTPEDVYSNSMKGFNLVNIIGVLWKNLGEDSLSSFLKWLQEQKHLLETEVVNTDNSSIRDVINRLNNYIMFLQLMADNPSLFSPVIDEIASVIQFLLSDVSENSRLIIPESLNGQLVNAVDSLSSREIVTHDSGSQAVIKDFQHVKDLFSVQPEPFLCNNAAQGAADAAETFTMSQHEVQTDNEVQNCNELIFELKQYILHLEQEKSDLNGEVSEFQEQISNLQEHISNLERQLQLRMPISSLSVPTQTEDAQNEIFNVKSDAFTSSVTAQTDFFDLESTNATLIELQTYVDILEQEKSDYEDKILELESLTYKSTSTVSTQSDDFNLESINSKLIELQKYVGNLELEKSDYENKILKLEGVLNRSTSTVLTQTKDSYVESLNTELIELQAFVDILEQEKLDFEHKISQLESMVNKSTSTIPTQTDEFSCNCNVRELEASVRILELDKAELLENISSLETSINKSSQNVDCQTEENSDLCEMLKSEVLSLKGILSLKDKEYIDSQQEMNRDLINYEEKLKIKDSIIQEKENAIQSLEQDLVKYKIDIDDLNTKVQRVASLTSSDTQTNENSCSCKQYESEIVGLKRSMDEREKEFSTIQNQTIISVNNLKEELNSHESLISEKDSMLHAANYELEKCKREITNLTDELNNFKTSSLTQSSDNCSFCKKSEMELDELKNYISSKENEFAETENYLISNVNNLREFLEGKDSLINDKEETIQSLKSELAEAKINIKKHLFDLKAFKEKQDYAKDIDTLEECDINMIVGNCNRCKSILNGESSDNDLKNEVRVLQDKLKALDMDKNQLLCVLNEKTQECSSLKNEVHKLTNIVASEKQALFKLQQDNFVLRESRGNMDPELTKEAVQRLSHIIRDKDLEIESLKQKNATLTALIQDASSVPDHLQSLIEEKENLTKQINVFKADRDKIMVRYNTIDKDCRQYAAEVKKLQSSLSEQKEKFDVLEQKHFSVTQQYEEKQKSLINTQNEMIALKQRVTDLEQQQVDVKEKYGELLNKINSDVMVQLSKEDLDEKNLRIELLATSNSEKDHLIQEKDCLIHDLSQQIKTMKLEQEQQQLNLTNLQAKMEELTAKLKEHEASVDRLQNEKEALELRLQDKNSELGLLKDMNERLNMSLKEKEFTVQSMTEKISSLSHYISSDHTSSDTVDINQILADSESLFSKAQSLYKERDETLLALNQSKQENQSLRNEIQRMKSKEIHLKKELERLRMHLLEIEENYTSEALKAEEREKKLRDELVEVRRRAEISNTAIVDTNQRASVQIASLQEQLSMIANQRDQALAQVSTLEDKVQQHSATVSKLQLVLDQMQRGNERKIKESEKKFIAQLEKQKQLYNELEEKLLTTDMQLSESNQALEAASRLSEQLDAKEEIIANLKSELSKAENKFKSKSQEIDTIKSNTEGKVDRVVMKSLVLGYFSTPQGQKSEVIRLLARVLDFNQEEMEKAGIVVGRNAQRNEQKGLFSSIFGRLPALSSDRSPSPPEKSFTTLFVQFLENESQPIVPMPFPVEKMAHDLSFKQYPNKKSPTSERKSIVRNNPLLLDIDSAFPTFTPVPAVEYSQTPAPSYLRDVLE